MRSRTIAGAIIGLAMLVGTTAAQASTLSVDAPCYLEKEPFNATGIGFTAGGAVNFAFDGQLAASGTADPSGNFTQPLTAPLLPGTSLQHTFSLAAQDQTNPALAATASVTVTKRAATVKPHRAKPTSKVRFGIHGMPPGQAIYLHYVFHGKQRARVKMGTARAPCGTLNVRKRFFPIRRPRIGTWTFQFDNEKRYSRSTLPRIRGPVTISSTFR
jgi:hypothetical protein